VSENFEITRALEQAVAAVGGATTVAGLDHMAGYDELVLFAKIVGQAGASVVFTVQVSMDGTTWFTVPVGDLTGADAEALAASVTVAANGATVQKAVLVLKTAAPYVQVSMVGAGAGTAVVDLYAVAKR